MRTIVDDGLMESVCQTVIPEARAMLASKDILYLDTGLHFTDLDCCVYGLFQTDSTSSDHADYN
jgi:hypothetical protein